MSENSRTTHLVARAVLTMALCACAGCSSWPWKSGGRDAERLTRVIHAENARLKDVVVQLRSSNEDMAQRSIDDAARIARLEDENEQFRMSVAAYQTERERMARSFQSLQEQVRLALGDRSDVLTTSFVDNASKGMAPSSSAERSSAPPEGVPNASGNSLEIPLSDWFAPNSAILKDGLEPRLARLGQWLSARLPTEGVVRFVPAPAVFEKDRNAEATEPISPGDRIELSENGRALESVRARRLWDAILGHLPSGSGAKIRFDEAPVLPQSVTPAGDPSRLIVPLAIGS